MHSNSPSFLSYHQRRVADRQRVQARVLRVESCCAPALVSLQLGDNCYRLRVVDMILRRFNGHPRLPQRIPTRLRVVAAS